jgi:transposase
MAPYYVGIDFHKNTSDLCFLNSKGEILDQVRIRTDRLVLYLSNKKDHLLGIEASGGVFDVVDKLKATGHVIKIINPVQFRAIGIRGKKNDRHDAMAIARALWMGQIPEVYQKNLQSRQLKSLLVTRDFIVRERVTLVNHVRGLLREFGFPIGQGVENFILEAPVSIKKLEFEPLRELLQFQFDRSQELQAKEEEITLMLEAMGKQNEVVARMSEVPGIGILSAIALVSFIEDPHRFKDSEKLASYLGLTPRERSSGGKERRGAITKAGPELLRRYVIHGARASMRYAPTSKHPQVQWAHRLSKRAGFNKAVVALARKNAIIAWAMWRKEQTYNENKMVKTVENLEKAAQQNQAA